MGHPALDSLTFVSGVWAGGPRALSLDELRAMGTTDLVAGFECSGNSKRPIEGLVSNGRWTGVPLRAVLDAAGLKAEGQEVVFFGADHREEDVEFRGRPYKVDQHFGRSLPRQLAFLRGAAAFGMNGEPLTRHRAFRPAHHAGLGTASEREVARRFTQVDRYPATTGARVPDAQGRADQRRGGGTETAITRMRLKSPSRVTSVGVGPQGARLR
jgi:hypothetical protein